MKFKVRSFFSRKIFDLGGFFSGKDVKDQVVRAGVGSVIVKIVSIFLGLLLAVLLARFLGPEAYGIYSYVFVVISILAIPAQFGLPRLIVRETAKAHVNKQWGLMRGIWKWATLIGVGGALVISLVALGVFKLFLDHLSEEQSATFLWGLVLLPFVVLTMLQSASLQGLRHVVLSKLPQNVFRPIGMIVLIFFTVLWSENGQLTAAVAMELHVFIAGFVLVISAWFLHRNRPLALVSDPPPVYQTRLWVTAVLPLALSAGMLQINKYADIVMLGYLSSAKEVGIYRISVHGAMLAGFGLQVVAMFISPYFARLHEQRDYKRLQYLATLSARYALFVALSVFILVVVWGEEMIRLLFGYQFVGGYASLVILAAGQLIQSFFGFVGFVLNMCGYQRDMARSVIITAIINIILNAILIPSFGMIGAAVSTTLALLILNIILWRYARQRLGIDTTVVGRI